VFVSKLCYGSSCLFNRIDPFGLQNASTVRVYRANFPHSCSLKSTQKMRLLELKAHGEFSLTEFVGDNIPPYAILSHTWGADSEEVTFKDLVDHTGKNKAGYTKIKFCAEQAASDGLQYFWMDTCSIDKSSSAELTEAINSMFRWYHGAAKCYVYLSDVSIRGYDKNGQFTWESAFRESRWFTRGWTLQELIAPTSVEFFSLEGKRLGDKKSLERQVHEITGIAIQALQGNPLSNFSVIERMSWAAKRKTTRKEDEAYSLLGIFDIHMPLIYGEGEKAINRLKEEIDKSSKGKLFALSPTLLLKRLLPATFFYGYTNSIPPIVERPKTPPTPSSTISFRRDLDFVDHGAGNVHWKVPHATNRLFTGRTEVLERVKNVMRRDVPDQKRFIITGLGGLGKSEICLKIANEMRQEYATTLPSRPSS
jgi:Heterokaryon incompatibility protein (HET)